MTMPKANWLNALRENAAAFAAGARTVPFADNGRVHRHLAIEIASLRLDAVAGRLQAPARPPHPAFRTRADDLD
jgi:hypothetical protein